MATLTDRSDSTMDVLTCSSKLSVGKRRVSVDALANLKTTTALRLCFSGSVLNG